MFDRLSTCRTAALGGHLCACAACGHQSVHYNACRDRHCPSCASGRTVKWLAARQSRVLPVPHFQVVLTLPHQLLPLTRAAPALVYKTLLDAAASSLQDVLKTDYDARFAISAVLHTWTRELLLHPHVHLVVSGGGLSLDDAHWVSTGERFLVSTRKLEPLFKGRMMGALRRAIRGGELDLVEPLASRLEPQLQAAAKATWVLHVEPPKKRSPGVILRYLARYLFRVGIDDRRVLVHDGHDVTIRTRGNATATMSGLTFVRRFTQHALPHGFRKVRHYGLLAPGNVNTRLLRAFELLGATPTPAAPPPAPDPTLDPRDDRVPRERCPACGERAIRRWSLSPQRGPPPAPSSTERPAP